MALLNKVKGLFKRTSSIPSLSPTACSTRSWTK
jgi:hypothetical protein